MQFLWKPIVITLLFLSGSNLKNYNISNAVREELLDESIQLQVRGNNRVQVTREHLVKSTEEFRKLFAMRSHAIPVTYKQVMIKNIDELTKKFKKFN